MGGGGGGWHCCYSNKLQAPGDPGSLDFVLNLRELPGAELGKTLKTKN